MLYSLSLSYSSNILATLCCCPAFPIFTRRGFLPTPCCVCMARWTRNSSGKRRHKSQVGKKRKKWKQNGPRSATQHVEKEEAAEPIFPMCPSSYCVTNNVCHTRPLNSPPPHPSFPRTANRTSLRWLFLFPAFPIPFITNCVASEIFIYFLCSLARSRSLFGAAISLVWPT